MTEDTNCDQWKTKPWRNYVWTLHNYTDKEIAHIKTLNAKVCKCIIFGQELTQDNIPHLQGYIELNKATRFTGLKALLNPEGTKTFRLHCQPRAAHATRDDNIRYCSKGLQSHEEYESLGEKGPNYGKQAIVYKMIFKKERAGQGMRNDWNDIYESIKENPDFGSILDEYPEYAIKYPHGIQKAIDTIAREKNLADVLKEVENDMQKGLFKWEAKLKEELTGKPDPRKIIWYVDTRGNSGKSTFCKYLLANNKESEYFTNGTTADIARAYKGRRICLFDFTRTTDGRINYSIIESIKNGLVFSGKYDSELKIFRRPHVICLANYRPNEAAMSADRWDIREITDEDREYPKDTMSNVASSANFEDKPLTKLLPIGSDTILDNIADCTNNQTTSVTLSQSSQSTSDPAPKADHTTVSTVCDHDKIKQITSVIMNQGSTESTGFGLGSTQIKAFNKKLSEFIYDHNLRQYVDYDFIEYLTKCNLEYNDTQTET